jgi:hypothetical protein
VPILKFRFRGRTKILICTAKETCVFYCMKASIREDDERTNIEQIQRIKERRRVSDAPWAANEMRGDDFMSGSCVSYEERGQKYMDCSGLSTL